MILKNYLGYNKKVPELKGSLKQCNIKTTLLIGSSSTLLIMLMQWE